MAVEACMNGLCKNGFTDEWKKGWPLRSGGFARLCNKCGSTYDNSVFCDEFHHHQTGWRECSYCKKPIHCGCIMSRSLFKYLDFGGIGCVACVEYSQPKRRDTQNPNVYVRSTKKNASDQHAEHTDGRQLVDSAGEGNLMQFGRIVEANKSNRWRQAQRDVIGSCLGPNRQEDRIFSNVMKASGHSLTSENTRPTWETKSMHESLPMNFSLGTSSGNCVMPSTSEIVKGRFQDKPSSSFHKGQKSHPTLSQPSRNKITVINLETSEAATSQERIAREPVDERGKNELQGRYWPRISDQELEQLAGDLNSNVVPLFEKVLSVSDAGKIGRLVLPKSCAEVYFPPISEPEGVPFKILDVKGNEWTFQFRFWPNNNSRMYVLEGVTTCIQSFRLKAGDIVTFSRIDPGGKLVMGFRKASYSTDTQDAATSAHSNGIATMETTFPDATKNQHSGYSYPDLLQSRKGNGKSYFNEHSECLRSGTETADLQNPESCEMVNNDLLRKQVSVSQKKRTRNIGLKNKRLLIQNENTVELRLTWEEAQELLCPPPNVKPSIVTIDGQEFEEYDEPPIFGKRTVFNGQSSGSLYPTSEEMNPRELENVLGTKKGSKKRRTVEKGVSIQEPTSGLDALASAAVLGDDHVDSQTGVTTKHPRHRGGCTCIVCIQPPSGRGRHKPTCTCNVCITVKRRQNTLSKRHQKKRRLESEADANQEDQIHQRSTVTDANGASTDDDTNLLDKEGSLNKGDVELDVPRARQIIDLNLDPNEDM